MTRRSPEAMVAAVGEIRTEVRSAMAEMFAQVGKAFAPRGLPDILEPPASVQAPAVVTGIRTNGSGIALGGSRSLDSLPVRLAMLVKLKRAYEKDLGQAFEPETVEYEHQRGIVAGLQMAVDSLSKAEGIKVEDPLPPKTRTRGLAEADGRGLVDAELGAQALRVLQVAALRHEGSTDLQLAIYSGYSVTSGGFGKALATLRAHGYLVEGDRKGRNVIGRTRAQLPEGMRLPTQDVLVTMWRTKLPTQASAVFSAAVVLARASSDAVTAEELAQATHYSITSGGFGKALAKLRKLGLLQAGNRPPKEFL